jgi:hypothetical protein
MVREEEEEEERKSTRAEKICALNRREGEGRMSIA